MISRSSNMEIQNSLDPITKSFFDKPFRFTGLYFVLRAAKLLIHYVGGLTWLTFPNFKTFIGAFVFNEERISKGNITAMLRMKKNA